MLLQDKSTHRCCLWVHKDYHSLKIFRMHMSIFSLAILFIKDLWDQRQEFWARNSYPHFPFILSFYYYLFYHFIIIYYYYPLIIDKRKYVREFYSSNLVSWRVVRILFLPGRLKAQPQCLYIYIYIFLLFIYLFILLFPTNQIASFYTDGD